MTTSVVIVGAGKGERFGKPKLLVPLMGKSLLQWNIETALEVPEVTEIVVVVPPGMEDTIREGSPYKEMKIVSGGENRLQSVQHGVAVCTSDLVLIQNVANPLASTTDYHLIIDTLLEEDCAAFVGQPVVDTLRKLQNGHSQTLDRTDSWRVQTPQGFRRQTLQHALENHDDSVLTDEIQLFEKTDTPIRAYATDPENTKITYPEDLDHAERLLQQDYLIGIGEDSHFFDESGTMMIGGIAVHDLPQLKGNSDGDLVLHALYNAISSAVGGRSIGPTADPMAEQGIIDSSEYLSVVLKAARKAGYIPHNVSLSLECSRPKVEPLVETMKTRLSALLHIPPSRIGITATSGEQLTPFGRGEGVKCTVVVSLTRDVS